MRSKKADVPSHGRVTGVGAALVVVALAAPAGATPLTLDELDAAGWHGAYCAAVATGDGAERFSHITVEGATVGRVELDPVPPFVPGVPYVGHYCLIKELDDFGLQDLSEISSLGVSHSGVRCSRRPQQPDRHRRRETVLATA